MFGFIILIVIVVLIAILAKNKSENAESEKTVKQPEGQTKQPDTQRPKKETKGHKVAGTSFRQDAFSELNKELNPDYNLSKSQLINAGLVDEFVYQYTFNPKSVELMPEPSNEHDPNAIKVVVDGVHIGYIKKGSCAHIRNLMANDGIKSIEAKIYGGKYKVVNSFNCGDDEKPDYELESGNDEYKAKIEIIENK
jgi:hypothetical protein